ncbi:MAG: tyrosine-type recombinase/integrase [Pseudonocardia sp.]
MGLWRSYVVQGLSSRVERPSGRLESSVIRGQWVDPTDQTTVAEYARRWAAARPYRPTTARRVNQSIENHLAGSVIGSRRLASVRPSDVQAWAAELAKTLAPSTLALTVNMLKSIYAAAVLDRLIASSPVVRVSLPRADAARIVPLTVGQVRQLAAEVPRRCRAMVFTQAGLGLRLGELLALRACDVSFLGRTVRVEHQLAEGTRERVDPKTPRSRRTIPLPEMVGEALAEHMREFPPLADGSLFYGHNERPYAHALFGTKMFKAAVRRLAEAEESTFPSGTTTHDLRHHYASVLLAAGESVVAVAERLGHDDATMVIKVYGHLMPDSEDRTRKAIDEA